MAEKVRGKSFFELILLLLDFLDAEPLSNAEVIHLLKERTDALSKERAPVPM